jgi:hypothetical protein
MHVDNLWNLIVQGRQGFGIYMFLCSW